MKRERDILAAKSAIAPAARCIAIVAFDGVEILDVAGPASVFSKANVHAPGSYDVRILAAKDALIHSNSGLTLVPHGRWDSVQSVDTLIVAGGHEDIVLRELRRSDLANWIASVASGARRVASVCTGALALAEAGLLSGRRSTTHWSACGLLQDRCPSTEVVSDQIFVRDGNVWTSAGILTGIDLSLALVEADLGRKCAVSIARLLVLTGMRPGSAPQESSLLTSQAHASRPLSDLLAWIGQNLTSDLCTDILAERMRISPRHLNRVFQNELGISPSKYVLQARVKQAAILLRDTVWTIDQVATRSGFESTDTLQRAFQKHLGVSPGEYRRTNR